MRAAESIQRTLKADGFQLTGKALASVKIASEFASNMGRPWPGPEHLLFGLVKSDSIATTLFCDLPNAEKFLENVKSIGSFVIMAGIPPGPKASLEAAKAMAQNDQRTLINCLDLTLGALVKGHDKQVLTMSYIWAAGTGFNYSGLAPRVRQLRAIEPLIEDQQFLLSLTLGLHPTPGSW